MALVPDQADITPVARSLRRHDLIITIVVPSAVDLAERIGDVLTIAPVRIFKERANIRLEQSRTPINLALVNTSSTMSVYSVAVPSESFRMSGYWERNKSNALYTFICSTIESKLTWGPTLLFGTDDGGI